MKETLIPSILLLLVIIVPVTLAFGLVWRTKRFKGTVSPVSEKILRPPGYSLSLKIEDLSDGVIHRMVLPPLLLFLSFSPFLFFGGTISNLSAPWLIALLLLCLIVTATSVALSIICFRRYFITLSNHCLGLRGEWLVAESLTFLAKDGFRIYHDFPLKDLAKGANIDHIVIGPTGVIAVETKMRRKHRNVQGSRESHQVEYDGHTLKYPTFEDDHGIKQALANARYLEQFIRKEADLAIPVEPILILPGWYVVQKVPGRLQVVSHKVVCDRIKKNRNSLDADQQRAICRCVERECRDVVV